MGGFGCRNKRCHFICRYAFHGSWRSMMVSKFFLPKYSHYSGIEFVWCEDTFNRYDKAVHSFIAHRRKKQLTFQLASHKLFNSIIRMKIRIYIFLANIPRFTTQKLERRCNELLLYNRNVCYIRNRTGLGSTLRLCICLAKLIINTLFIIEQKALVPFLKHLWFITTLLLELNGQISVQHDVTLISGKFVRIHSS